MGLKLWVPSSKKAFGAELFPKVPFSVTTAATMLAPTLGLTCVHFGPSRYRGVLHKKNT